VITERIVDLLLLMVIFILTLFAQFSQLSELATKYIMAPLGSKLGTLASHPVQLSILISVCLMLLAGLFLARKKISRLLTGKFGNIIRGFGKGLSSVKDVKHKFQFIVLSLAIWTAYFYGLYFCFFAFSGTSHLGQSECLVLLLFGTFGVAFSAGGLGAYPAIVTALLLYTYHVEKISAVAFPWMVWTSQFILILVLGILSLIALPVINRNKTNDVVS